MHSDYSSNPAVDKMVRKTMAATQAGTVISFIILAVHIPAKLLGAW